MQQHITRVWREDGGEPTPSGSRGEPMDAPQGSAVPGPDRHASGRPALSVVLITRSSGVELTRALEALAAQTCPAQLLEIIVVCASADPDTARAVAALARNRPGLRLRFVRCAPERGVGAARNRGWRHATGNVVGFTTDDVIPSPEWVASALDAFNPAVDIVGGQLVVPLAVRPGVSARRVAERLQAPWSAHNVFYRRSLLRELDGFDEEYSHEGHDDTDLVFSALTAGAHYCAAEGAVVVYGRPIVGWRDEVRHLRLHADEARLYRKHPRLYAQFVRSSPPVAEYLSLTALCVMIVCAVSGRRPAASIAAALWAGFTLLRVRHAAREVTPSRGDLLALLGTTMVLPPVTVAMRLYGAVRHRVWFL